MSAGTFDRLSAAGSTFDLFRRAAEAHGGAPALTHLAAGAADAPAPSITQAEFFAALCQTASMFASFGVGRHDVVSILTPNLPQTHLALWGAQAVGVASPLNLLLNVDHLAGLMAATQSKVLVACGPSLSPDLWAKALELRARVPSLEALLVVGGAPQELPGVHDFDRLRCVQPRRFDAPPCSKDDMAVVFHTGGTTGMPKLAPLSHRNLVHAAAAIAEAYALGPGDTLLNGLPLFHVGGSIVVGLAPLAAGAHVVMLTPSGLRDPAVVANYWRIAARFRATIVGGVPTSLGALAAVPAGDADLGAVRMAISGAATLPTGVAAAFEARAGVPIHQVFGMTETAGVVAIAPSGGAVPPGSVGKAVRGVELRIVARDADGAILRDCASGEPGHLLVRGPNVFGGYSGGAGNPFTEDGWLATGDLARLDAEGHLFVTGRAKDVIIRGGHNVDPAIVEEALALHGDVAAVAAVGAPDAYAGEVPVAFAVLRPGTAPTPEALAAFAAAHIAEPPARPRQVFLIDALPMTAAGKIFKPELRRLAAEKAAAEILAQHQPEAAAIAVAAVLGEAGLSFVVAADGDLPPALRRAFDALPVPWVLSAPVA